MGTLRQEVKRLAARVRELEGELAAEKALADQIYEALFFDWTIQRYPAIAAYCKARGL